MLTEFMTTNATEAVDYRAYQGGFFKVLISPEQTGGHAAVIDMTLPRGAEPPRHLHTREDEAFYLLEGAMTFQIGTETIQAQAGQMVVAPRQIPHQFQIMTPSARFLTLITPGPFLEYFLEFSFPAEGPVQLSPPQGLPPTEQIAYMTAQLNQRYGVLFL